MWIACGQERLADSAKIIAKVAHSQGVVVRWEQYLALPHTWAQLFPDWWQSKQCFRNWSEACKRFTDDAQGPKHSTGCLIEPDGSQINAISVGELTSITPLEAMERIKANVDNARQVMAAKVCLKAKL